MVTEPAHADLELTRLRREHGKNWRVWRTDGLWLANARVTGVEPTLVESSPAALEARMQSPDRSVGGPIGPVPI